MFRVNWTPNRCWAQFPRACHLLDSSQQIREGRCDRRPPAVEMDGGAGGFAQGRGAPGHQGWGLGTRILTANPQACLQLVE